MGKNEIIEKLKLLKNDPLKVEGVEAYDINAYVHIKADELVIEFLRTNGFLEIADAYDDINTVTKFWYT